MPTEAITGIAKKAAEILRTDGAIVSAPGQPASARMVISRSGKRPYLILPKKKGGGLTCDDECPQYKSAKLCSHIVAAAEDNKQLETFIASYGSTKKTPNLTKLATAGMPKGRGSKGGKAPAKRRPSVPVETQMELNPVMSGCVKVFSPSIQVSAEQTASQATLTVYQPTVTNSVVATSSVPDPAQVSYPSQFLYVSPLSPFPRPPMASPYPIPCAYPGLMGSPYLPLSPGMDPTGGGLNPFRAHFICGNINICHGCK